MRCKVYEITPFWGKSGYKIPTLTDTIVSNKGRYFVFIREKEKMLLPIQTFRPQKHAK